jgi:hypothetical protein
MELKSSMVPWSRVRLYLSSVSLHLSQRSFPILAVVHLRPFLPDEVIDLVDEAASSLRLVQE